MSEKETGNDPRFCTEIQQSSDLTSVSGNCTIKSESQDQSILPGECRITDTQGNAYQNVNFECCKFKNASGTISGNGGSQNQMFNPMSAVFLVESKWPPNSTIKVSFLEHKDFPLSEWRMLDDKKEERGGGAYRITYGVRSRAAKLGKALDDFEASEKTLKDFDNNNEKYMEYKTLYDKFQSVRKNDEPNIRKAIEMIVKNRLENITNLTFDFMDDDRVAKEGHGNIRISLKKGMGSYSVVGRTYIPQEGEPVKATMNFGWLDVGTILHEFCHSIGMIHEHQNPFGDAIPWNKQALYEYMCKTQGWDMENICNNIIKKYDQDRLNGSAFDEHSIMLYSYPPELTTNNKGYTENFCLSAVDKCWIFQNYPIEGVDVKDFCQAADIEQKKIQKEAEKTQKHFEQNEQSQYVGPSILSRIENYYVMNKQKVHYVVGIIAVVTLILIILGSMKKK